MPLATPEQSRTDGALGHHEPQDTALLFDENYYRTGLGLPYERNEYWLGFFAGIAEHIMRSLKPRRVLDAGCAMGMLMEAFWDRGVEAWGIDISPFAISQVRPDMRPYCRQASLSEPIEGQYDLVTCIEVLEHLHEDEARAAAANLTQVTDRVLFSSTPDDFGEATHFTVRPPIYWLKLFAEFGFWPDLEYDANYITPHAMLLRQRPEGLPDEALTLFARSLKLRGALVQQSSELDRLRRERSGMESRIQELAAGRDQLEQNLAVSTNLLNSAKLDIDRLQESIAAGAAQREQREAEIRQLANELNKLQTEGRTLQRVVFNLGEQERRSTETNIATEQRLSDLRAQIDRQTAGLRARIDANTQQITSILHSRIWRTLRAVGNVILHAQSLPLRALRHTRREQIRDIELVCDEPLDNDVPKRGVITVQGWATAPSGIDHVMVHIDGLSPRRADFPLPRPDIAKARPHVKNSGRSGFALKLDPASLSPGKHRIHIEAVTKSGLIRRTMTTVTVEHAFASDYDRWISDFEPEQDSLGWRIAASLQSHPLISIVMPVYNTPPGILKRTIESVRKQSYGDWELCIADDASNSPELDAMLDDFVRSDPRIKIRRLSARAGISAASNAALQLATGEFVALLDHDDELAHHALLYAAEAINGNPDAGLLYSDEDKIDVHGNRFDPFFKPDWSPDLLLSENYICHLAVMRRDLIEQAGGFRPECDGSQDHDLFLRVSRLTDSIVHIPRVLYHWRAMPTSTAADATQKPQSRDAARLAIEDHLRSQQIAARVEPGSYPGRWRVRYPLPESLCVSILIPSGGNLGILRRNLDRLAEKTAYPNYKVVVIDNSKGSEIARFVRKWNTAGRTAVYIDCRGEPFNWSALNNNAARRCDSPFLLFLNDDTEVIAPDWLSAMLELAARPEVGAVGAKLLYPDGRIQHAGVIMGVFDNCGHAFKGLPGNAQHYFDFPDVIRDVSAVTGACLMTRREVFIEVGGFDEEQFAVAFNDIDFCLKVRAAGYRVLYTPHALLYHHEAFSKTVKDLIPHIAETTAMQTKWKQVIDADPYYSRNLTRESEDYSLGTVRLSDRHPNGAALAHGGS